ncbi:hypothetical protein D3C72_2357220 [compost metagenome]
MNPKQPLSPFEQSTLLLAHPREEVRLAGIDRAISLLDDPTETPSLHGGVDLFRFIYTAGQEQH